MVLPSLLSSRSLGSEGSTTPTDPFKKSVDQLPLLRSPVVEFEGDEAVERIVRKLGKFTGVKANTLIDNKLRKPLIEELATKRRETFQELFQLAMDERGDIQDWSDKAFATKIIEVVDGTYSTMPPLHPQTRSFMEHATKFLECRRQLDGKYLESEELQQIARLYVPTDSGGIETDKLECKQQYQQQSSSGAPVRSMKQLYEAANTAEPVFNDTVLCLVDKVRKDFPPAFVGGGDASETIRVEFPKQKARARAMEKAENDYSERTPGPAISWLYDILRVSIHFCSADQIAWFLDLVTKDENIHIVQAKNRFANPGPSGYRDILLHVQINTLHGFKHICEIQIHHKEFKKLDKELKSQFYYEFFRSYLVGGEDELKVKLEDLELVSGGITGEEVLDEHGMEYLLQEKMQVSEINRFIALLSTHVEEYEWAMRFCAKLLWRELNSNGPSCLGIAKGYNKLASILQKTYNGEADDETLVLLIRSLKIMHKQLGKGDLEVAQTHENIASILTSKDEPKQAIKHLQGALEIKTMILGEDHLSIVQTYAHVIEASLQLNKIVDVVELCQRSLQMKSERLAEDHTDLADIYRKLGGALLRQSNYYDALERYERSLEIRKTLVGENDKSLMEDYKGILHVHFHCGRLNRVQEFHKRISIIRFKISKGTDPLNGKQFIKTLKSLRIAFAPFCLCLNGSFCRKLSRMGVAQKHLKGYMIEEAFEGVSKEDRLSPYLKSAHLCLV